MDSRFDARTHLVGNQVDVPKLGIGDQSNSDYTLRAEWAERMRAVALVRYLIQKPKHESDLILRKMANRHGEESIKPVVALLARENYLIWNLAKISKRQQVQQETPAARANADRALSQINNLISRKAPKAPPAPAPSLKATTPKAVTPIPRFGSLGLKKTIATSEAANSSASDGQKHLNALRQSIGKSPAIHEPKPTPEVHETEDAGTVHLMDAF